MERPATWYVYTYLLLDDTVFYVGKGTGNRINYHEREAASDCVCRKCSTIREIWASGNPVKKRIVFETFNEVEALAREFELIQMHSGKHLTNERKLPVVAEERNIPTPQVFAPMPRIIIHSQCLPDDQWQYEE